MNIDENEVKRVNDYIIANKLKVTHFRYFSGAEYDKHGGMTVVWHESKPGKLFTVATSICSKKDIFVKSIGRVLAVQNFENGFAIELLSNKYRQIDDIIFDIFSI